VELHLLAGKEYLSYVKLAYNHAVHRQQALCNIEPARLPHTLAK